MSCILLFEIEYSLECVSTNPPFLSRPSDTKIRTAIILVVAIAKIPKIWKRTPLDAYFLIYKCQDCAVNQQ